MRAFLLAAGLGTRLRPLTERIPKCMVPIGGRPLLDIWLDSFAKAGVDEVLVNLHYLPSLVRAHLASRTGPPTVYTCFEPELLGSAGTLRANQSWVSHEDMFLACYADNLTSFDLGTLITAHRRRPSLATITAFRSEQPSSGGVLELGTDNCVISFAEKPAAPASDLVNAGIYAFQPAVIDEITGAPPRDIGYHLLPRLVNRAYAVTVYSYFRDIGTLDGYQKAQNEWPALAER